MADTEDLIQKRLKLAEEKASEIEANARKTADNIRYTAKYVLRKALEDLE
jgi:vacuolar-type H+-ATPase subunit E/Vma4